MKLIAAIITGGAIGSLLRYWISAWISDRAGALFPWGTFAVNVAGCFAMGVFFALTRPDGPLIVSPVFRAFVMIGLLGGFTTFSSFSLQTLTLLQDQEWSAAVANVLGSVAACLAAVWLGVVAVNWIGRP